MGSCYSNWLPQVLQWILGTRAPSVSAYEMQTEMRGRQTAAEAQVSHDNGMSESISVMHIYITQPSLCGIHRQTFNREMKG